VLFSVAQFYLVSVVSVLASDGSHVGGRFEGGG
jgi:hypothetical protein